MSFFSVRRAVLVGCAALLLTGAARFGVHKFLSSARGKAMVADRLGTAFGMPVEVSEVSVQDGESSFGFRVMDPADPKAEVLNVPSASTDIGTTDFVTGRVAPSTLHVKNPALTLRISTDGNVLTPIPSLPGTSEAFPAVVVDGARLSIRQEGRPAFAVSGVNVKFTPVGERIVVSGAVKDAKWSSWSITGEFRGDRAGWVELACPNAPLDRQLLETVPFLPSDAFEDVALMGRAAVKVRLTLTATRDIQPSVEIRPTVALFGVPLGPCFRLVPTSDGYYFEPTR
ncbi:Uncharacterized protein OS=Singulisphaera acidiphila (strain ATCC BAA-1392 / DSM 18658 / VKM B-2454 / MOB10) GN=Sinac_1031 PE=4 SV=1 [Gemmata massiliana]|uniref:Uncharacterized protein n=1 Tax=Gemmata massiliana TaxID=1210884 RepID=A0A6P2DHP2_9BACT|nr:hypothetical protein [Gemmata massiliana]VTS01983.1 Uncharacterized protein OS=Singulisphaera acidiphila (strain ATCC BAA-1392 / DSM 18658 / VKM B-2454 / MOB10) GN=Sinac_1031 PE=4 SV=1 [Gemmata massiliana]